MGIELTSKDHGSDCESSMFTTRPGLIALDLLLLTICKEMGLLVYPTFDSNFCFLNKILDGAYPNLGHNNSLS